MILDINEELTLDQLDGVVGGGKKIDVIGAVKYVAGLIKPDLKALAGAAQTILDAAGSTGPNPHQL
jgi:hypothetical protein